MRDSSEDSRASDASLRVRSSSNCVVRSCSLASWRRYDKPSKKVTVHPTRTVERMEIFSPKRSCGQNAPAGLIPSATNNPLAITEPATAIDTRASTSPATV